MAVQKPTPEEKLFAVIQGAKHPPLRLPQRPLSLATLGAAIAGMIGPLDLPRVNQGLTIVVVALGMLCVMNPLFMRPRIDRLMSQITDRRTPVMVPPLEGLRPLEEYLESMTKQDPFRIAQAPPVTPPVSVPPPPPKPDPRKLLSGLRLVGISWGEEPVAMIEESQQTHVLKAGDAIGGFAVKEILKDRVILRMDGEDMELF